MMSCVPSIAICCILSVRRRRRRRRLRRDGDFDLLESLFEDGVTEVDPITALVGRRPHQALAEPILRQELICYSICACSSLVLATDGDQ